MFGEAFAAADMDLESLARMSYEEMKQIREDMKELLWQSHQKEPVFDVRQVNLGNGNVPGSSKPMTLPGTAVSASCGDLVETLTHRTDTPDAREHDPQQLTVDV